MADTMKDRDDVGYVPKADATRGSEKFPYPGKAQKIEPDQTALRPHQIVDAEVADDFEDDALEGEEPGKNRGGRYGDGW